MQLGDKFGRFFIKKIDGIVSEIEEIIKMENIPDLRLYSLNTTPNHQHLINFKHVSTDEIRKIIIRSKTKSSLLDPIPTSILKDCLDVIITPITDIINSSLQEGSFPSNWKTALVSPIPKKTRLALTCKNFQPVSNLPFTAKLVEKTGLNQYVSHLSEIGKFYSNNSTYKEKT